MTLKKITLTSLFSDVLPDGLFPDICSHWLHFHISHLLNAYNKKYLLKNHRITQWFGLEGAFKDHLVHPPYHG